MPRMNSFSVPHKGLRNGLGQLSLLAGSIDYNNHLEVEKLYALGITIFQMLTIHAGDEDDIVLAQLEERSPGSTKQNIKEHEQLHIQQHELEDLLEEINKGGEDLSVKGAQFYRLLNVFIAQYLLHIDGEEIIIQPLLWQHFTDDELAGHRALIMRKNPPPTLLNWFRFSIPAQSHAERVGLLKGFKMNAPQPFFEQGLGVIKTVLSDQDYRQLTESLGE
jgi:hypothetical protein